MAALNLGDARAEQDYARKKSAFFESPDYRTLIESDSKSIVVGRRGVGKSALFLRLTDYYHEAPKVEVFAFAPEEYELVAFRPVANLFDGQFRLVRAATRVAFRYALIMEIANALSSRYKFHQSEGAAILASKLTDWRIKPNLLARVRYTIEQATRGEIDPESRVGALAESLDLNQVESALASVLEDMGWKVVVLVDRLDEGYLPDDVGIGIVDGFVHAAIDLKDKVPGCRSVVFLRDNIYRAVEQKDDDFSRNLEQAVLRLHWEERALLNFAANRIRAATEIKAEKSIKVWDAVTQASLQGEAGFHTCLRLTLYRPRDLLLLLNESFRHASANERFAIDPSDVESSARSISENRFQDLVKEYSAQLPGLSELVRAFFDKNPSLSVGDAEALVAPVIDREDLDASAVQQFRLFSGAIDALRGLYSIGFLGVKEAGATNYVFSHDGRRPDKDFASVQSILVHPCYWIALNLHGRALGESEAAEIYDEYDVSVTSETPQQRAKMLGRLEAELREIELGLAGAHDFERWCHRVVNILFAGGLRNVELNPNKGNLQRRDVVGTNHGSTKFWKRVLDTYGSRQVLFEVKNFAELGREEFWQMNSYLTHDYGSIGFIITRDDDINLRKDRELAWVRELRYQHNKIVVRLTAQFLASLLNKIRSPAKHDAPDDALDKLLDTYIRNYFSESAPRGGAKRRRG